MPKNLKGDPLRFLKVQFAAKYQGGPFEGKKFEKSRRVPKKLKEGPFSLGLEPVTAGFPVNRMKSVLKSGTSTMRSVV